MKRISFWGNRPFKEPTLFSKSSHVKGFLIGISLSFGTHTSCVWAVSRFGITQAQTSQSDAFLQTNLPQMATTPTNPVPIRVNLFLRLITKAPQKIVKHPQIGPSLSQVGAPVKPAVTLSGDPAPTPNPVPAPSFNQGSPPPSGEGSMGPDSWAHAPQVSRWLKIQIAKHLLGQNFFPRRYKVVIEPGREQGTPRVTEFTPLQPPQAGIDEPLKRALEHALVTSWLAHPHIPFTSGVFGFEEGGEPHVAASLEPTNN